jgi:hypothetical protein
MSSYWVNFRESDLPLPQRLAALGSNYWRRIRLRQTCCGHYGDPGC